MVRRSTRKRNSRSKPKPGAKKRKRNDQAAQRLNDACSICAVGAKDLNDACSICAVGAKDDPCSSADVKKQIDNKRSVANENLQKCAQSAQTRKALAKGGFRLAKNWSDGLLLPKGALLVSFGKCAEEIKLPVRLAACCFPRECRNWALPALAGLFAQAESRGTSVQDMTGDELAKYNADIVRWHSWLAKAGRGGRSTCEMTKNLQGGHWITTVAALSSQRSKPRTTATPCHRLWRIRAARRSCGALWRRKR